MKCLIYKASSDDYFEERNFNTIQELHDFMKEVRHKLVLKAFKDFIRITIYDSYIE